MKAARRYFVTGKVQGVGYRRFVQRQAGTLGLAGWTRNLYDGRVEVYAVGLPKVLDELKGALGRGPAFAVIENVDMRDDKLSEINNFEIHPDGEPT